MNNNFGMTINGDTTVAEETEIISHFSHILHPKKRAFLSAFVECAGSLTAASRACQIHHTNHYYWYKNDPQYAEAFDLARHYAADIYEAESIDRSHRGLPRAKFAKDGTQLKWKNPQTGQVEDYIEYHCYEPKSMFHLKALFPEKYVDPPKSVTKVDVLTQSNQKLEALTQVADELGIDIDFDAIFKEAGTTLNGGQKT